jgi:hypothetical protein
MLLLIALFLSVTLGPMVAHGAEADPYACFGAGRYDAMRDGRECPAAPKVAWYCKPFVGLERSCTSVKLIAKSMGAARAEKLARKCGATDSDIEQAKACLSP